mgnify:CR=1 FL=1
MSQARGFICIQSTRIQQLTLNNPHTYFFVLIGWNASRDTKSQDGYQAIYPFRFDIRLSILSAICKQNKHFENLTF